MNTVKQGEKNTVNLVDIKSHTFHCAFKACDVLETGGKKSSQSQIAGFSHGINDKKSIIFTVPYHTGNEVLVRIMTPVCLIFRLC